MATTAKTIHGVTRLTFDCLSGITSAVTQMHEAVVRRSLPLSSPRDDKPSALGGITRTVYSSIQSVIGGLSKGAEHSFNFLAADSSNSSIQGSRGLRFESVLNGICGDHLESTNNALATPMHFSTLKQDLPVSSVSIAAALPNAGPHIAVYVHGLCLSGQSWAHNNSTAIGDKLEYAAGLTPVYLQYNSGRHISTNGREFAALLEQLVQAWPVPVESLSLVGHSMGGLVIRSACWYAEQAAKPWLGRLKRILFLGTPHHGAPLEKAGHLLTLAMRASPYLAPLDFGKYRSAGIKDLRFGNLLDEDWQHQDADSLRPDARRAVPLQPGVDYYFIAATVGQHQRDLRGYAFGDLLVRSGSAVGAHADRQRNLDVDPDNCRVLHRRNHFDLLTDPTIHAQILSWFTTDTMA